MALKINQAQLMKTPVMPSEPEEVSLTFHSMLLVKIHNYFSNIGDDCSKKIVEDMIVSAKYLNTPKKSNSRSLKGGSGSNSDNEYSSRPTLRPSITRRRLKTKKSKPLTEDELRLQIQNLHLRNIEQGSDGLTIQQHLYLLHDSAAKASIPAIFTKLILAFTIDSVAGITTSVADSIKSSVVNVGDTGAQLVKGTVENVGVLNLAWNMLNLANKVIVKSSNFVFSSPSQELTQTQVASYIKNIDEKTDSMIYNLTNFSFSTKVAGYVFLLWAIICYNYLLWAKRREILKKAKESEIVLYRLANDARLQPPVDDSLSNMWLGAVPAATGIGTMAIFRDPALSMGVARMTDRVVHDYFKQREHSRQLESSIYLNKERVRPPTRTDPKDERGLPEIDETLQRAYEYQKKLNSQRAANQKSQSRKRTTNQHSNVNSGSNGEGHRSEENQKPKSGKKPRK